MILEYLVKKLSPRHNARISKDHCIYYRNRFDRCTICRYVCKDDAIISTEDEIKIDNTKCKQCGLCKAKCPSQSITIDNFGELDLLKKSKEKNSLYIGCKRSSDTMDFAFNCLNGLHVEYLIAFFILNKDCEISFALNDCKDCKINLSDGLEEQVKLAIKFLKNLNINVNVKLLYENVLDMHRKKLVTRRELFQSMKEESINVFQDFVVNAAEQYYGKDDYNDRKLLVDVISKFKKVSNQDINIKNDIFTSFKVSSNCDGCGFCEGICPYNAWKITEVEGEFNIGHNPSKCRGCKLCSNLCSNKSIEEGLMNISDINSGYIEKLKKKR